MQISACGLARKRLPAAIALFICVVFGFGQARADDIAPSPAPSASPRPGPPVDVTVENDPTTRVRTISFQASYTGATYGPGNFRASQIIPRLATFEIGKSLARISLPRVQTINGVDSGFSDMQVFYLFQRPTHPGAGFVGVVAQFPTAPSRFFGTGKWLVGPAAAYVAIFQPGKAIAGALFQAAFSVAGASNRRNQAAITFLPFASLAIGHGWFLKWPEAPWLFDLEGGTSLIPVGLGIGHAIRFDGDPMMIAISDETSLLRANAVNAPKNTIRLTITLIVRSPAAPAVP